MLDPEGCVIYIADHLRGQLGPAFLWKALAPLAVPHKQLIGMLQELAAKGEIAANGRIFDVVKQAKSLVLIERLAAEQPNPVSERVQDFTIETRRDFSAPEITAAPAMLMLPAPGETSTERQPTPRRRREPEVEPEPISPLMMTDREIVDKFIAERCNKGPRVKDTSANLYAAYCDFCEQLNVMQLSQKALAMIFRKIGCKRHAIGNGRIEWIGLEVASTNEAIA